MLKYVNKIDVSHRKTRENFKRFFVTFVKVFPLLEAVKVQTSKLNIRNKLKTILRLNWVFLFKNSSYLRLKNSSCFLHLCFIICLNKHKLFHIQLLIFNHFVILPSLISWADLKTFYANCLHSFLVERYWRSTTARTYCWIQIFYMLKKQNWK